MLSFDKVLDQTLSNVDSLPKSAMTHSPRFGRACESDFVHVEPTRHYVQWPPSGPQSPSSSSDSLAPLTSELDPLYPPGLILCQWDGGCGTELDDVSPGGVERHLIRAHISDVFKRQLRGCCLWKKEKQLCSYPMMQGHHGKHIASKHLCSTGAMCKGCHGLLSRLHTKRGNGTKRCPCIVHPYL